jgi:hypothetical protein
MEVSILRAVSAFWLGLIPYPQSSRSFNHGKLPGKWDDRDNEIARLDNDALVTRNNLCAFHFGDILAVCGIYDVCFHFIVCGRDFSNERQAQLPRTGDQALEVVWMEAGRSDKADRTRLGVSCSALFGLSSEVLGNVEEIKTNRYSTEITIK